MIPLSLFFFLKISLTIQGVLQFHTNFRVICSSSVKNVIGILIETALNAWIVLGSMVILTVLVLPVCERGVSSICTVLSFFHHRFIVFKVPVFHLLGEVHSWYFILFCGAVVKEIVLLVSLSATS